MKPPLVSVVIVSYNSRRELPDCLDSLYKLGGVESPEMWVVDNASGDGTVALIRERFPQVRLIVNLENRGFARAVNQGLRRAHGRYLLLLNPDMLVLPGALRELVRCLEEHPRAGLCGGNGRDPAGRSQPQYLRSLPTPTSALAHFLALDRLLPRNPRFGRYNRTDADRSLTQEAEALSGSCMLARREAVREVGLLDERFPMYAEDLDWCLRFRQRGWQVYYAAEAHFIHYHGRSSRGNRWWARQQFYRTMHAYYTKHLWRQYPWWVNGLVTAGILVGLGVALLRIKLAQ